MKAKHMQSSLRNVVALSAAFVVTATFADVGLPPSSSLQITPGTGENAVSVSINDPCNHVWVLQSSSDLKTWSEVEALKIHNGSFARGFPGDAAQPGLFFRSFYDATRQDIPSTVENALLLPTTSFNYAAPALPLSFLVNPILAQDNMPAMNVTTDLGATLGRVLFYDKRLSTNQTVSCASCHQQKSGFSDPQRFSVAISCGTNAPTHSKTRCWVRFKTRLKWA